MGQREWYAPSGAGPKPQWLQPMAPVPSQGQTVEQ
jgi:hypothetical protein